MHPLECCCRCCLRCFGCCCRPVCSTNRHPPQQPCWLPNSIQHCSLRRARHSRRRQLACCYLPWKKCYGQFEPQLLCLIGPGSGPLHSQKKLCPFSPSSCPS